MQMACTATRTCTYAYSVTSSPACARRQESAKRAAAYAMDNVALPAPCFASTTCTGCQEEVLVSSLFARFVIGSSPCYLCHLEGLCGVKKTRTTPLSARALQQALTSVPAFWMRLVSLAKSSSESFKGGWDCVKKWLLGWLFSKVPLVRTRMMWDRWPWEVVKPSETLCKNSKRAHIEVQATWFCTLHSGTQPADGLSARKINFSQGKQLTWDRRGTMVMPACPPTTGMDTSLGSTVLISEINFCRRPSHEQGGW